MLALSHGQAVMVGGGRCGPTSVPIASGRGSRGVGAGHSYVAAGRHEVVRPVTTGLNQQVGRLVGP
jgi:hypothetical protein